MTPFLRKILGMNWVILGISFVLCVMVPSWNRRVRRTAYASLVALFASVMLGGLKHWLPEMAPCTCSRPSAPTSWGTCRACPSWRPR